MPYFSTSPLWIHLQGGDIWAEVKSNLKKTMCILHILNLHNV